MSEDRKCACVSDDARQCFLIRHPECRRYADTAIYDECECDCCCHEIDEDLETMDAADEIAFAAAVKVYDAAFKILDQLEQIDGSLAGSIAKAVQDVVEYELRHVL